MPLDSSAHAIFKKTVFCSTFAKSLYSTIHGINCIDFVYIASN